MKQERAMENLEYRIIMIYLETYGWDAEECDWEAFIFENMDSFVEYRQWYLAACA